MTGTEKAGLEEQDDACLLRRIVSGDESALSIAYDRYRGCVFSLLVRILREESAAEEILQDVFLYLWENASRFDPARGVLRSWLLVMARNRAISRLRRRPPEEQDEAAGMRTISTDAPQDLIAAQDEIVSRVRLLLAKLPPEQSETFNLAYFSGMTHAEIAVRMGQPLGTVKTRLRAALGALRRGFEQ